MPMDRYPFPSTNPPMHHAHFLGKVKILVVLDIHPCEMHIETLETWAQDDGFPNFRYANEWFTEKYDDDWMQQTWTMIKWNGWLEKYFLEVLEVI